MYWLRIDVKWYKWFPKNQSGHGYAASWSKVIRGNLMQVGR